MSDVSRKIVPDKGSLNKDRQVTKPLVSVLHKKEGFFPQNWNGVCEKECIQRDMITGMILANLSIFKARKKKNE